MFRLGAKVSMWIARNEKLAGRSGIRFSLDSSSGAVTVAEVIQGWRDDADFRTWFNSLLANTPFEAFRWETPSVTTETLSQPFECVVLDSPGLDRTVDAEAFAEHFHGSAATVVSFTNLSGDAVLVVPSPVAEPSAYGHLASFVRRAPESQQQELWKSVGEAMTQRIGAKPVWLSTAGAGVSWLHVRLDNRPKYYGHGPYRVAN
jgi:hypothetical protein